jgi:hypothetical protein
MMKNGINSPSTYAGTSTQNQDFLTVPTISRNGKKSGEKLALERTSTHSTSRSSPQGTDINGTAARPQFDPHQWYLQREQQIAGYNFADLPMFNFNDAGVMSALDVDAFSRIPWSAIQRRTDANGNRLPEIFKDAHFHPTNYTGEGHHISHLVKAAKILGVGKFVLDPIPTTLVSRQDDEKSYVIYKGKSGHCGEPYYVPIKYSNRTDLDEKLLHEIQKTIELRPNPAVDRDLTGKVKDAVMDGEILPEHLDMMDLGMTGSLHLGDRRIVKEMIRTLHDVSRKNDDLRTIVGPGNMGDHRLRISHVGEVTLRKEVVEKLFAGYQADLKKNLAPTREAMRFAGIVGLPFTLHCDVDMPESLKTRGQKNKRPMYLDDVKDLMRSCPNTEIVWAHAGGLGRFVKEGRYHLQELEAFMQDPTLQHVKLDISWSVVADQISDSPAATAAWAQFMHRHQRRILFGSDSLTPNTNEKWTETYDIYNQPNGLFAQINVLDPTGIALQNITGNNYDSVFTAARERVDCFSDYILPEIIKGVQSHHGPENIDLVELQKYRNAIYAHHADPNGGNYDPRVARARTHFRTDLPFPPVVPEKHRSNQLLKGAINRMTFGKTMKAYKPETGRSGDYASNKLRKKELDNLRAYMNQMQPNLTTQPERDEFAKAARLLRTADEQLNTSLVPDELLRDARAVLVGVYRSVRNNGGVNMFPPFTEIGHLDPDS